MNSVRAKKHWGNLEIGSYINENIDPLMPILQQEFPNWNSKRIKAYMDLVNHENSEVSGVLAAKNEYGYYVGCLIFTYQQIDQDRLNGSLNNNSNEISNVFVVENINSCIPILQKQIFLALIDECINIAEDNNCDYLEVPTLGTDGYDLVKKKYKYQIQDPKNFRTYLKLAKCLTAHMEI